MKYPNTCGTCGATRIDQQIGLEPDVRTYVQTMVEVFREVKRVLADSGTLLLNLGDSYASAWPSSRRNVIGQGSLENGKREARPPRMPDGLKEKDLMMIPARVALALQADGWYLRSAMPWIKRSAMPESTTDRPTTAIEYVFLFSKRSRYFWDAEAVRRGDTAHFRKGVTSGRNTNVSEKRQGWADHNGFNRDIETVGRNYRNSDMYFDSLDDLIDQERAYLASLEAMRANGGLLLDENGDPLALDINPAGFKDAHFATFSVKLVEPMIRAGTSEKGQCPACGAPWRRMVEPSKRYAKYLGKGFTGHENDLGAGRMQNRGVNRQNEMMREGIVSKETITVGWEPTCPCVDAGDPVPQTVLDLFVGAGTTLMVADRLGRNGIGVELNPAYAALAQKRITDDAPMFASVEVEQDLPLFTAAGLELPSTAPD